MTIMVPMMALWLVLLFFVATEITTPPVYAFSPVARSTPSSSSQQQQSQQWSSSSSLLSYSSSSSSSTSTSAAASTTSSSSSNLPTLEALKTDPFMKQVQYGGILTQELVSLLAQNEEGPGGGGGGGGGGGEDQEDQKEDEQLGLRQALAAQLSHPDGIRGFMVSFLTYENDEGQDDTIPEPLLSALLERLRDNNDKDNDELVELMCMNVIIPTAMTTLHTSTNVVNMDDGDDNIDQDEAIKAAAKAAQTLKAAAAKAAAESSARTAQRGVAVLRAVLQEEEDEEEEQPLRNWRISENLRAIYEAAATATADQDDDEDLGTSSHSNNSKLVQYWKDFFVQWGYQEKQLGDIAKVTFELLLRKTKE